MAIRRSRLALVILATASLAPAQRIVSAKSGLVYFAIGRVWVDNTPLKSGEIKRQLSAGETLFTERGRTEVLMNPGAVLRLGDMSRIRMEDVRLTDACVSLLAGAAVVTIKYLPKGDRVEIHVGSSGVVVLSRPGVYRFDAGRSNVNEARLRVFSGLAEVQRRPGATAVNVRSGRALEMDDLQVTRFDSKETDELEQWADRRAGPPAPGLRPIPPRVGSFAGVPSTQPENGLQAMRRALGLDSSNQQGPGSAGH